MRVNQTKKFKLFKPFVASSLTLILNSSLYGSDAIDPYYKMVKAKDDILIFQFSDGRYNFIVSGNQILYIIDNKDNEITFKTFPGQSSEKTTIDFNGQSNKTFKLLAETSSFQGNLQVIDYKPHPSNPNNTFNATFNYGMTGDINIGAATNPSNANTTLTFGNTSAQNSSKELKGNITIYAANTSNNTITFREDFKTQKIWTIQGKSAITFEKNATIQSSSEVIYTGWWQNRGAAEATFTFKGTTNLIKNNIGNPQGIAIQANANSFDNQNAKNILKFEGDNSTNTIEGAIIATANLNHDHKGINEITFNEKTATNTIKGSIIAKVSGVSENNIIFKGKLSNIITGSITANGGINKISMNGNNTIVGIITATADQEYGKRGSNYLYFSGEKTTIGNNKITDETKAITTSIITNKKDENDRRNIYNFLKLESKTNTITLNS
ncbi:hypothetical protein LW135_02375, partial [Helicobacter sp. faydin-H20]|uniref:hypothetical protein n=1 Tax=Helicobacter anatolicus TaxID=2905874 RepID=UPI001E3A4B12